MRPAGRARKLAVAAVAVAGAAAASVAVAAGPSAAEALSGRYTTDIASTAFRGGLSGTWRLTLRVGDYKFTFTATTAKNVIISGHYSVARGRIAFKQMSAACSSMNASGCLAVIGCRGVGIYDFKRAGRTLSLVRVRDPQCRYRPIVLSGRFRRTRWRRDGPPSGPARVASRTDPVAASPARRP